MLKNSRCLPCLVDADQSNMNMTLPKWKLIGIQLVFGFIANNACATTTVTLSGLESGALVHGLSGKTQHTVVSDTDALLSAARRGDAMIMLALSNAQDLDRVRPIVEAAMDGKIDLLIEGPEALVAQARPADRSIWKPASRMFVSTRSDRIGLYLVALDPAAGVDQVNTALEQTRAQITSEARHDAPPAAATTRQARATTTQADPKDNAFQLPPLAASSPNQVCISMRNQLSAKLGESGASSTEIDKAVQRVCQYGTVAEFRATLADYGAFGKQRSPELVLNLRQQWLLLLSEDAAQPDGSRAYLWARTLGDHAGSGFSWTGTHGHAYTRKRGVDMHALMDASIHSGWGPVEANPFAWPSKTPSDMFRCEKDPNATDLARGKYGEFTTVRCPVKPRLLSLLPGNVYNDTVTIEDSTSWTIGGSYTASATIENGQPKPSVSLALSGGYTSSKTARTTLMLVQTSTNADTLMYRSTYWRPNWEATARWVNAKSLKKNTLVDLTSATPLAATLNPAWSIVWELPLAPNSERNTLYTSMYDGRHQDCSWQAKEARCSGETTKSGGVWVNNTSLLVSLPKAR